MFLVRFEQKHFHHGDKAGQSLDVHRRFTYTFLSRVDFSVSGLAQVE